MELSINPSSTKVDLACYFSRARRKQHHLKIAQSERENNEDRICGNSDGCEILKNSTAPTKYSVQLDCKLWDGSIDAKLI